MSNNTNKELIFQCLKITQPVGEFYIASLNAKDLLDIAYADVRVLEEKEDNKGLDSYIGQQRKPDPKRIKQISEYVKNIDACFPTGIIISIEPECIEFDEEANSLILHEVLDESGNVIIPYSKIAKIIDGQHRLMGLKYAYDNPDLFSPDFKDKIFELNVSIFVGFDVAEQAMIFATVNLAQTKVNSSLVNDLYDFTKERSPQKLCHYITITIDADEASPFYKRIKRLGVATKGRKNETLTQATFVKSLIKYICQDDDQENRDKDIYKRGGIPAKAIEKNKLIFRDYMIDEKDYELIDIIWDYFEAVRTKWPKAWNTYEQGYMLNKSNGFMGFMRFLKDTYIFISDLKEKHPKLKEKKYYDRKPNETDFSEIFRDFGLKDEDFIIDNFPPGTGGEAKLYKKLKEEFTINKETIQMYLMQGYDHLPS